MIYQFVLYYFSKNNGKVLSGDWNDNNAHAHLSLLSQQFFTVHCTALDKIEIR